VLFEEARRRRRRRWFIGLLIIFVVTIAVVAAVVTRGGPPQAVTPPSSASTAGPFFAHWTPPRSPATGLPRGAQITDVARVEGRLMAVGSFFPPDTSSGQSPGLPKTKALAPVGWTSPVVWTSVDGSAWSEVWNAGGVTLGTDVAQELVATPSGVLLFGVGDFKTLLWRSTNRTSFEPVTLPPAMGALRVVSATWGHGLVVAILSNKNTADGESDSVWTSKDGSTWKQATLGGTAVLNSIAPIPEGFLIGGETRSMKLPTPWTSTDGTNWNPTTLSEERGTVTTVASAATTMIAGGTAGNTAAFWWSKNASKWARATVRGAPPQPSPVVIATPVGFVASDFVVGGGMNLWASSSGAVWSLVTNEAEPSISTSYLGGLYPDQGGALAVIYGRSSSRVNVWKVSFTKTNPRSPSG
jgi:hypothetical protein